MNSSGRVQSIRYRYVPDDAVYGSCLAPPDGAGPEFESKVQQLVLAVHRPVVSGLVSGEMLAADRNLGKVRNLRSVPVASIDLYFSERVEGIPIEHVVMLDSRYDCHSWTNPKPGMSRRTRALLSSILSPPNSQNWSRLSLTKFYTTCSRLSAISACAHA